MNIAGHVGSQIVERPRSGSRDNIQLGSSRHGTDAALATARRLFVELAGRFGMSSLGGITLLFADWIGLGVRLFGSAASHRAVRDQQRSDRAAGDKAHHKREESNHIWPEAALSHQYLL
ncbi:MAG: hypothetical protein M3R13_11000 [Armatimonadota bacterium]|nr:hypothetical protein [Armatimonadota bacterium]